VRRETACVRPLLEGIASPEGLDLARLDPAVLASFLLGACRASTRPTARETVAATRQLLRFLHREGEIDRPLVDAVPAIGRWHGQALPKGLTPAELGALLASCDPASAKGRRDLAILVLLSRLGLRVSEVSGLCLEDIDWRGGQILACGKGRRSERLPLPADVGITPSRWPTWIRALTSSRKPKCAKAIDAAIFRTEIGVDSDFFTEIAGETAQWSPCCTTVKREARAAFQADTGLLTQGGDRCGRAAVPFCI
jgi:integrase